MGLSPECSVNKAESVVHMESVNGLPRLSQPAGGLSGSLSEIGTGKPSRALPVTGHFLCLLWGRLVLSRHSSEETVFIKGWFC